MMNDAEMEETLEARWVVDSETGIEYMFDLKTGHKLAVRVNGVWLNPEVQPQ